MSFFIFSMELASPHCLVTRHFQLNDFPFIIFKMSWLRTVSYFAQLCRPSFNPHLPFDRQRCWVSIAMLICLSPSAWTCFWLPRLTVMGWRLHHGHYLFFLVFDDLATPALCEYGHRHVQILIITENIPEQKQIQMLKRSKNIVLLLSMRGQSKASGMSLGNIEKRMRPRQLPWKS